MKNRRKIIFDKIKVSFASPEDLIIHKIFVGRPRDIEDIKNVLLKNKINVKYIKRWLLQFDKTSPDNKYSQVFIDILKEIK